MRPGRIVAALATALIATVGALAAPTAASAAATTCTWAYAQATLPAATPTPVTVAGQYCSAGPAAGKTVVLLLHGERVSHAYAQLPYKPSVYSFVDTLTQNGFVVFNVDRVGSGQSSRPAAADVTVPSEANVYAQLVGRLRAGTLPLDTPAGSYAPAASRVIVAGHSLGAGVALVLASSFGSYSATKVDGIILTGLLHNPNPSGLGAIPASFQPATADPYFNGTRGINVPPGYFSPRPVESKLLEFSSTAELTVRAQSTLLRDTSTSGQLAAFNPSLPAFGAVFNPAVSQAIHSIPVLSIVGQVDPLFCNTAAYPAPGLSCASPQAVYNREATAYSNTCLETGVLTNASHSTFWHPNTNTPSETGGYPAMINWAHRRVGTLGHAQSQLCLAA